MKKIMICSVLFLSAAIFTKASAQFRVTNNSDLQPKWGLGGQEYVEYYYLPDIETYYYVPRKQFIYQSGGHWTFSSSLPDDQKKYNLYKGNKVVINQPGAYRYYDQHKIKYTANQIRVTEASEKDNSKNKNKRLRDQDKDRG